MRIIESVVVGRVETMNKALDELLAVIATEPVDISYDRLEWDVMASITRRDRSAVPALGWQAAAIAVSLGIGTIIGGTSATAARPRDAMSVFTPEATLAPSSLLVGDR